MKLQRSLHSAAFCLIFAAAVYLPQKTGVCQSLQASSKPARVAWHTGSAFQRAVQSETGFTWQDQPLRDGLMRLAEAQRVAIFLDRRVDPNRLVTFSVESAPLETALRKMTGELQLGVGFVGPVIYIGPPLTCARIATLAQVRREQVKELPAAAHQRVLKSSRLLWPELTEPRLLVARAATSVGLTIPNIRAIPHDAWPAADLPEMTFPEQATLLLAGFDNSFRYGKAGRKIFLARFPRMVTIERRYRSSDPEALAAKYGAEYPQAFVEVDEESKEVVVKSLLEDHAKIIADGGTVAKSSSSRSEQPAGEKRHTLNVKNQPAGKLILFLANKFKIDLKIDPAVSDKQLAERISISVKEVSSEELLQQIAAKAELRLEFGERGALLKTN